MNEHPRVLGLAAPDDSALRQAAETAERSLRDLGESAKIPSPAKGGARLLVRGTTAESVADALGDFASGKRNPALKAQQSSRESPRVAFVFAGQSETRIGMGAELYRQDPTFAKVIDRCSLIMGETLGTTLSTALYDSEDVSLLDDARLAQPALFALQNALVAVWKQWGVTPAMVAGHSLGEYAAACTAGVFSLDDGVRFVAARGALTQSLARGGLMAVLFTDEDWVAKAAAELEGSVSIAAINAPEVIVVSGETDAITKLVTVADAQGINAKALHISHPFHSRCIDPMLDGLEATAANIQLRGANIPFVSTLEGRLLDPSEPLNARYWRRHAREPVRFLDAMRQLEHAGCTIFLELGPHATLTGLGERCVGDGAANWLPSLKRSGHDWRVLTETAAKLWLAGVDVDLAAIASSAGWQLLHAPLAA
jgi:acyl transferase domain-containing protein